MNSCGKSRWCNTRVESQATFSLKFHCHPTDITLTSHVFFFLLCSAPGLHGSASASEAAAASADTTSSSSSAAAGGRDKPAVPLTLAMAIAYLRNALWLADAQMRHERAQTVPAPGGESDPVAAAKVSPGTSTTLSSGKKTLGVCFVPEQ